MQYRVLKKENQIEIHGFYYTVPQSYGKLDYVLPFSQSGDTVVFDIHKGMALNERIKYISELDFLTYVYLIAKAADSINNLSDGLLKFSLDLQLIFCDGNSVSGTILPAEEKGDIDCKSFFWDMLFAADFETKNLSTVKEFLGFIRAAISVMPQDVILFIEMGQLGKQIAERISKKSVPEVAFEPGINVQPKKEDINSQLQTGNDFSDFLAAFEGSSYEYEEDEEVLVENSEPSEEFVDIGYEDIGNFLDNSDVPEELVNDIKAIDPEVLIGLLKDLTKKDKDITENEFEKNVSEQDKEPLDEPVENEIIDIPMPEPSAEFTEEPVSEYKNEEADIPVSEQKEESLDEPVVEDEIIDILMPEPSEEPFDEIIQEYQDEVIEEENNEAIDKLDFEIDISASLRESKKEQVEITPIIPSSVHRFNYSPAEKVPSPKVLPTYEEKTYLVSSDGRSIPIVKEKTVIGRGTQNVDLTVNDGFVSRVHAQIVKQDKELYLIDLKPRNSSTLNDKPIESERLYKLKDEDRIRFGKTLYYFRKVKTKR